MYQLSNNIRKLRFEHDEMTQKALAERVGTSRQTMNAIENCHHAPTVSVAIRIADVFDVTVDEVFELDYEGKPARQAQATSVEIDRAPVRIDKPVEAEVRHEPIDQVMHRPIDKKADRELTLEGLRNIIG